jgi:4-amino-4-deoxy-L-arabinose transferase-like glycosyltransferase
MVSPGNPKPTLLSRLTPWVFCCYLVVIAFRFGNTTLQTLRHPFLPGADLAWFTAWMGLVAILAIAYGLVSARHVTRTWLAMYGSAALLVVGLSKTGLASLVALWIVLLCAGLGSALMRVFLGCDEEALCRIACGIPLGTAILATAVFLLGLLHYLTPLVIVVFFLALTTIVGPSTVRLLREATRKLFSWIGNQGHDTDFGIVLAIAGFAVLLNLTWAVAPEVQFDVLNYHLAVPKAYLERSGIFEIQFYQAYFARLVEMVFAACLALSGASAAKLWVFLTSLCCATSLFAVARSVFDSRVGVWAVAFFLTTPLVSWLSGTAYIDNAIALFVTSCLFSVLQWREHRNTGWLYIAALLGGAAVSSKLTAVFAIFPLAIFALFHIVFRKLKPQKSALRTLVLAILAFTVTAAPTYAVTYAYTGNPIFPLMNGVFQSPKWNLDNTLMNASSFGLSHKVSSLLRFPFALTFDTTRFGEALPRGGLGIGLLLTFPFAALFIAEKKAGLLVAVAAAYMLLLFYSMQYGRYYIVILPAISILGAAAALRLPPLSAQSVIRVLLLTGLVFQPLITPVMFWNIPERFPIAFAFGSETREAFLDRALLGYSAAAFVNTVSRPDEKILGVDTENLRFYLNSSLVTLSVALKGDTLFKAIEVRSNDELAVELKRIGFSHLLVTRASIKDPPPWHPYLKRGFLGAHASLKFQDDFAMVYELR